MQDGELLFMHSTQKSMSMQARMDTHSVYIMPWGQNPDFFYSAEACE